MEVMVKGGGGYVLESQVQRTVLCTAGWFQLFQQMFLVLYKRCKCQHYYLLDFSCRKNNLLHCITSKYTASFVFFMVGTLSAYATLHKSWQVLSLSVLSGNYFHGFSSFTHIMCVMIMKQPYASCSRKRAVFLV